VGGTAADRATDVVAVVLTHLRPRLAGDVVRGLLEREGFAPDRVVVVVNGVGGLDDGSLEERVRMVRLPVNTGPAGGFRAGLEAAFDDPAVRWAYLCEDDLGLFSLPAPRVADVLARVSRLPGTRVGAVVAYGRRFVGRGVHTVNVVPAPVTPGDLVPVDVACWGATLVARPVVEAGILPDGELFFGVEDFDFFCRLRRSGFAVVVDGVAARSVAAEQTGEGRSEALAGERPDDTAEAWRAYYNARNSLALVRRYGTPSWWAWQVGYVIRWAQKARSRAERRAVLHGTWDGLRGRLGANPTYRREVGEYEPARAAPAAPGAADGER
jgi:hypothetical protein